MLVGAHAGGSRCRPGVVRAGFIGVVDGRLFRVLAHVTAGELAIVEARQTVGAGTSDKNMFGWHEQGSLID